MNLPDCVRALHGFHVREEKLQAGAAIRVSWHATGFLEEIMLLSVRRSTSKVGEVNRAGGRV